MDTTTLQAKIKEINEDIAEKEQAVIDLKNDIAILKKVKKAYSEGLQDGDKED